jgi:hypothetical protein
MRCLFKLAIAVTVALLAQYLVQPGGAGDEFAFATRIYVNHNVFGVAPDAPEMVDAAARLRVRQGSLPARFLEDAFRLSARPMLDADNDPIVPADVEPAVVWSGPVVLRGSGEATCYDVDNGLACSR